MPLTPEARDLVARTILGETGGQDQASMTAVANVIKNRLNSGAWGPKNRLGPVIKDLKQFTSMTGGGKAYDSSDPNYQRAGAIADAVFSDQPAADNTDGATHYANVGSGQQGQQIGSRIFYRGQLPAAPAAASNFVLPAGAPMGMGNNNPLNIKYYPGAERDYAGLIGPSSNTDQGTPQMKFSSPEAGWSAAYNLLKAKYNNGKTTPMAIIAAQGGWTPGYTPGAINVAKLAGIGPNDDINFNNPAAAQRFMRALVLQEQGGAGNAYPDSMIASAIGGSSGAPVTSPSNAPTRAANPADAIEARNFLASLSAHTDRAGDTANLNPDFAVKMANAVKQARAEGLPVSVMSAYRTPGQTGSAYDAGGNSSHSYGLAVDVAGLDGPNGRITQRWAQIAQANGLSNPYGIGNHAEFNHWQLPPVPLEQTPQMLAQLKTAAATGDFNQVWAAYAPTGETPRLGPYQPTGEGTAVAANQPAPAAQPVKAALPAGALPGGQPAGSQPDPNARFQVLQTMGQGGRPGLPYTALNLTPGAGTSPAPAASAAPAPAAPATPPAATPDLTQRVLLNQTPPPPPRPTPSAIGAYPDSTNYPTGLGLTPPTQTSSMPQSFQTSLSNPVQAFLSRLFQTG